MSTSWDIDLPRRSASQRLQNSCPFSHAPATRHQTTPHSSRRSQLLPQVLGQHGLTRALNYGLTKKGATFSFAPSMKDAVRALLAELAAPPILVFPDWDAVIDKSRPFRLHCDASTDGLGTTREQKQPDGSTRLIVYTSRVTLANERK